MKKKENSNVSTKILQIQTWFGLWLDLELKLSLEWKGKNELLPVYLEVERSFN